MKLSPTARLEFTFVKLISLSAVCSTVANKTPCVVASNNSVPVVLILVVTFSCISASLVAPDTSKSPTTVSD